MTSVLVVVLLALLGATVYLVLRTVNDKPSSSTVAAIRPTAAQPAGEPRNAGASADGDIAVAISGVSSGKARFFDYTASNGASVRFFVIKSSDGVYRAALDACDVCFAAKKGYYQDGDNMVCRNCGRNFPSALVNEVSGGCNPVPVARTIDGNNLIIKASELENRRYYF
jgi:uncharacterized membrane protein